MMKGPKIKHSELKLAGDKKKISICWENRQVSLLKYKEQIFQIALELHKYISQGLFLSNLSHNPAAANQER